MDSIKTREPTAAQLEPLNDGKSLRFLSFIYLTWSNVL